MAKRPKVYQYPKCSTCVKALNFLAGKKIDFDSIEITEQPPTKAELRRMLKAQGDDLKKLFNTSGVQYRELKIAERLKKLSTDEALDLLAGNGRLVKRPFVLTEDGGLVGFREDDWKKNF